MMTEIEILRAEIKTKDERIKELHALASGYSPTGTDACRTCHQGRVTIFTANKQCTECDPSGYERGEWVRRNSTIAKDRTIKRLIEYLGPMLDAEDTKCHFDHHGSCQSHGWCGIDGGCPIAQARAYLAKLTTGQ